MTPAPPTRVAVPVQLWIVGQYRGQTDDGLTAWEFQGVFTTEAAAVAACRSRYYWVAPARLNQPLPGHTVEWPGAYYPHEKAPDANPSPETPAP